MVRARTVHVGKEVQADCTVRDGLGRIVTRRVFGESEEEEGEGGRCGREQRGGPPFTYDS